MSAGSGRQASVRQIEAEVGTLIKRVRRVIAERAQEVHESLHPSTFLLLTHLADHGPLRASAIVGHFAMDKASVSRQVQHLLDLGLVDRTPDPEDGRATLLSVSDDGVGIPSEDLDRIFQPFHGGFAKGAGLGLAIVHRIVSDQGGSIAVHSQAGQGTTIDVILPALRRTEVAA